jgi:hypothetical protein
MVQSFERGRIYAATNGPTVYVPKILADALPVIAASQSMPRGDAILREFYQIGWPVHDPDWYMDADNPTWAFQHFDQRSLGPAHENTLEVRGRSPELYIERIGGDMDELRESQSTTQQPAVAPEVNNNVATIWQSVPCAKANTDLWPTSCDMSTLEMPSSRPTESFGGEVACNTSPGECKTGGLVLSEFSPTPMWGTFSPDVPANTLYEGIIKKYDEEGPFSGSHLAGEDFPFNHDNCYTSASRDANFAVDVGLTVVTCTVTILGLVSTACSDAKNKTSQSDVCRSDWNLHTRPLPAHKNWQFLATENLRTNDDFEIEFEAKWGVDDKYFDGFLGDPGDLVAVHGRSIIDCGHCPYKAEVHPPDVVAVSENFVQAFGNAPSRRETHSFVWVNRFLNATPRLRGPSARSPLLEPPLGDAGPVTAPIYAPPRTSARATLQVAMHESQYYHKSDNLDVAVQPVTKGVQITFHTPPHYVTEIVPATSLTSINLNSGGQWKYPSDGPSFVDYLQLYWRD